MTSWLFAFFVSFPSASFLRDLCLLRARFLLFFCCFLVCLLLFLFPFLLLFVIVSRFGELFDVILGGFWGHVGVILVHRLGHPFLNANFAFLALLGGQLGPKLAPSSALNRHPIRMIFKLRFGSDFEASWGRFWEGFGLQNRVQNRT